MCDGDSMSKRLGVLDLGVVRNSAPSTIADTVEIAEMAESLGFHRYWLAEHPEQNMAWGNPTLLMALLAGGTTKIRVGVAGVLVAMHDPVDISSEFSLADHFFGERLDFGFSKGASGMNHSMLRCRPESEYLDARIEESLNYLYRSHRNPSGPNPIPWLRAPVRGEPWALGTSRRTADFAIKHGINFAYSLWHSPTYDSSIVSDFHARVKPGIIDAPTSVVSISLHVEDRNDDTGSAFIRGLEPFRLNISGDKHKVSDALSRLDAEFPQSEFNIVPVGIDKMAIQRTIEFVAGHFSSDGSGRTSLGDGDALGTP